MPFVRSSRGAKTQFNAVNVSATLSRVYSHIYGKNLVLYRAKIHDHTHNIIKDLEDKYGASYESEWKRTAIRLSIVKELTEHATREVLNTYLDLNPETNTERGKYQKHIFNEDHVDPVWNVYIYQQETDMDIHMRNKGLSQLGEQVDNQKPKKKRIRKIQISKRRSDWIEWWKTLSADVRFPLDFDAFEKNILNYNDTLSYDSEGWWTFWQNVIFASLSDDPRLYHLLRVAQMRKNKSLISGQDWLDGTGLNVNEGEDITPFHLMGQKYSDSLYRALWVNYIKKLTLVPGMNTLFVKNFDLEALAKKMEPSRDQIIDWRGYRYLEQGGCLWPIPAGTVWNISGYSLSTKNDSKEPPQWAWMRLAMALALEEKQDKNLAAENFYNLLSRLAVLPTETLLREAGKEYPNFLEDKSTRVPDEFGHIWEAIHQAAVGTKWTGNVTLDWSEVRSEGAPISGGLRRSKGVIPFVNTINQALHAQGREEEDRPVTITIPIWHLESRFLISAREEDLQRIQPVIIIPDHFMKKVKMGEDWTFFDPSIFPEIIPGTEDAYTLAKSKIIERKKANPRAFKTVKAYKVWMKILTAMKKGSPYITFEDSTRSFDLFSKEAPSVHGLDGIGSFPLLPTKHKNEKLSWTAWPSMAVNLDVCLGKDGRPDLERLKVMVSVALRMLDNCIIASTYQMGSVDAFRSVCLGAVGFYEAVSKAVKNSREKDKDLERWMESLAEAWALTITQADLDLTKERGPAQYYLQSKNREVFNPVSSIEKLRKSHNGSLAIKLETNLDNWKTMYENIFKHGQRFAAKSVWAPFKSAAAIAGVSPGGIGTIMPAEKVYDNQGIARWVPTPILIKAINSNPENLKEYRQTIRFPDKYRKWASDIQILSNPNEEGWRSLMRQGALVRPWLDQGISLTLPTDIDKNQLNALIEQAWWSGISSIRFETIQNIVDNNEQDIDNVARNDGLD